MRIVVGLAVAGLVALVVAVVTGSTAAAVAVVVLALTGILLLLRDWRADRRRNPAAETPDADHLPPAGEPMAPDEFAPDISTEPGGPSSDARAD